MRVTKVSLQHLLGYRLSKYGTQMTVSSPTPGMCDRCELLSPSPEITDQKLRTGPKINPLVTAMGGTFENSSPCCFSVAQSCPTLCDPMDCSTSGLPVLHHLPELAQTHVH